MKKKSWCSKAVAETWRKKVAKKKSFTLQRKEGDCLRSVVAAPFRIHPLNAFQKVDTNGDP